MEKFLHFVKRKSVASMSSPSLKENDQKRLFFGWEVDAPWPADYPEGRQIQESFRHLTLAFLGNISFSQLKSQLAHFPEPSFKVAPVGICDKILFLPEKSPRVVSLHVHWLTYANALVDYQKKIIDWLKTLNYPMDERPLLSHISLARSPFDQKKWEEYFITHPLCAKSIHLYESIGNLHYEKRWTMPLLPAFEDLEHMADIAFIIRGDTLQDIFYHAAIALCFKFPTLVTFIPSSVICHSLEDIIRQLNLLVSYADMKIGCPFKAVSYHGEIKQNIVKEWEMIVDV